MRKSRKRVESSSGRARLWAGCVLVLVLMLAAGAGVAARFPRSNRIDAPDVGSIAIAAQARTGHQRAERLVFADHGRLLAVLCPRYNRLVIYRVDTLSKPALTLSKDVVLEGRPVALAATSDRLIVLQRPAGDARHTRPGFWDQFDFQGRRIGSRFDVGTDPDDLAISDADATALVLLSGCAEGETGRPAPSLKVIDISDLNQPRHRGELFFDGPRDDPKSLCFRGQEVAVLLGGSNQVAVVDASDRGHPRIIDRVDIPAGAGPDCIGFDHDGGLSIARWDEVETRPLRRLPNRVASEHDPARTTLIGPTLSWGSDHDENPRCEVSAARGVVRLRRGSRVLGTIELGGLGGIRVTDSAWFATTNTSGMLALSDRSGGVHLLNIRVNTP